MTKSMASTAKAWLSGRYPDCLIRVRPTEFSYLHRDDSRGIFENRSVPAIQIEVLRREPSRVNLRNNRPIYDHPETVEIRSFLRERGFCAEFLSTGNVAVIDAPRNEWPVEEVSGLGAWHRQVIA